MEIANPNPECRGHIVAKAHRLSPVRTFKSRSKWFGKNRAIVRLSHYGFSPTEVLLLERKIISVHV